MTNKFNLKTIPDALLQEYLNTSDSKSNILLKLDIPFSSWASRELSQQIRIRDLDTKLFEENSATRNKNDLRRIIDRKEIPIEEIFKKFGYPLTSTGIKKKILKFNLMEYVCALCGNHGEHNDKPLTLQLDHIDGDNLNNEISNLRFLCPNCHTQTETYGSKNRKIVEKRKKTPKERKTKISWPHPDELRALLLLKPTTIIAKELGVSDSAVGKFCKTHNIQKPSRGFWTKKEY